MPEWQFRETDTKEEFLKLQKFFKKINIDKFSLEFIQLSYSSIDNNLPLVNYNTDKK